MTFWGTRSMAAVLATMHWAAKIDANDVEFVLAGTQQTTGIGQNNNAFLGAHCLWVLDFDCCRPITMDHAGVEQAAHAFFKNDPYFPRPTPVLDASFDHTLWMAFRSRYLQRSREVAKLSCTELSGLPEEFVIRVEDLHVQSITRKSTLSNS